jgi:hypothetical protein
MYLPVIMRALQNELGDYGRYALSVYSIPGLSAHQIALRVGTEALPHGQMGKSTVERIREAGYQIALSEKEGYAEGHCDLTVPYWRPSQEDCKRLARLFDTRSPNPVKRPRGSRR